MPRRPAISVIIPVRDEQRCLPRALASLRRQSFTDFEVIVVDDGSRDATAALARKAGDADPRVRLICNEGIGFVAALNTGISHAAAPLIARLDADDASLRRRLEAQVRELRANPAAVALGTYGWRVNERGLPVGRLRTGPAGREGYARMMAQGRDVVLTHSSAMFRRAAAERVGGYDAAFHPADDFRLWNLLLDHGEVYAMIDSLTLYTLRAGSMSETQAELMLWQVHRASALRRGQFPDASAAADGAAPPMALTSAQRRWAARATTRRRLARALANGRMAESLSIVRDDQVSWREVRRLIARVGGR